jgi:hypothetical protein
LTNSSSLQYSICTSFISISASWLTSFHFIKDESNDSRTVHSAVFVDDDRFVVVHCGVSKADLHFVSSQVVHLREDVSGLRRVGQHSNLHALLRQLDQGISKLTTRAHKVKQAC